MVSTYARASLWHMVKLISKKGQQQRRTSRSTADAPTAEGLSPAANTEGRVGGCR